MTNGKEISSSIIDGVFTPEGEIDGLGFIAILAGSL